MIYIQENLVKCVGWGLRILHNVLIKPLDCQEH